MIKAPGKVQSEKLKSIELMKFIPRLFRKIKFVPKMGLGIFVLVLMASVSWGQNTANNYTFSTSTGNSFLAPTFTKIINAGIDGGKSAATNIGFNFSYEGVTYTQFVATTDGFIKLGNTASVQATNNITNTTNQPKLMPFWDDLSTASNGSVNVGISGTTPNQICVIDFKLYYSYGTSSAYNLSYQIWLHEGTNVIDFVYNLSQSTMSGSCGIGGATASNFISVNTSTNLSSNSTAKNDNASTPASGRMYTFSPPCSPPTITGTTPGSRCGIGTVSLGATASSGTINWFAASTGGASLGTGTSFTTPSISSTTTYYVDATDGCTTASRTSVSATVNTIPTPNPGSNTPVCTSNSINLTSSGGGSYSWTGPNSFTSTNQNPTISSATTDATGSYTLTVTGANGCTASASTSVTVNTTPTATAGSNSPVDIGTSLTLNSTGGGTYLWSGPNTYTSTSPTPTVSSSATGAMAGTYTITVTNSGCTATANTVVVVNCTAPTCDIPATTPAIYCKNATATDLTVNGTAGSGSISSYAWYSNTSASNSGGTLVATHNVATLTDSYTPSTVTAGALYYYVVVTNSTGCTVTSSVSGAVTINALPTATATSNSPVTAGNTLNLTGGPGSMSTYSWTGPDSYTSSTQSPTVSSSSNSAMAGIYTLSVTNSNGCTSTASTVVVVNPAYNTYYVNDAIHTGDIWCTSIGTAGGSGTKASPFLTLKAAITAASSGDSIKVDVGTYGYASGAATDENLTINKDLIILGAGTSVTIFDNNYRGDHGTYLFGTISANVTLKNFTIQNYLNDLAPGNALIITKISSAPTIYLTNIRFNQNGSSTAHDAPTISILSNTTTYITGQGSTCNGTGSTYYGGGIEVNGTNILLNISSYALINMYSAYYEGSALHIKNGNATTQVNLSNCLLQGNDNDFDDATGHGGGAIYMTSGVLHLTSCIVKNNFLKDPSYGTNYGVSICINGGNAHFAKCIFSGNSTNTINTKGGAIAIVGTGNIVTIDSCGFSGNKCKSSYGYDLYVEASSTTVTATNSTFGTYTGQNSIYRVAGTVTLTNCGTPTYGGTVTESGTAPTYTANPSTIILSGTSCSDYMLPVELISFSGECVNNLVQLNWTTASETNNNFFTIEKSADAQNWNILTTVTGAGTSNEPLSYSVFDENPGTQRNYYRLKQTDYDGQFAYSKVISVAPCYDGYFDMVVLNNPVNSIIKLLVNTSDTQSAQIYIKDLIGRTLYTNNNVEFEKGENSFNIDVSKLSNGIYILVLVPIYNGQPIVKEIMVKN
jgi:hypothetical protein